MAASKLTLSIAPGSIERAKRYAKKKHTSLSKLVEQFFNDVPAEETKSDPLIERLESMEIPEGIKALTGILKGKYTDDYDFKQAKYEYLKEKYDL